jgi:hypothetical protein
MKNTIILCFGLTLSLAVAEPEKIARFETTDGKVYEQAKITKVEPDGLTVIHAGGAAKIQFERMSAELQKKYGYDAEKAKQFKSDALLSEAINRSKALGEEIEKLRKELDQNLAEVTAAIKLRAQTKWKDDYRMVEYEIKLQTAAYLELVDYRGQKDVKSIVDKAEDKWGENYRMVVYEIKNQTEARDRINSRR